MTLKKELIPLTNQDNPVFADILISNLLSNAIKHNVGQGEIIIQLSPEKLSIRNTGKPLKLSTKNLFDRFKKADDAS